MSVFKKAAKSMQKTHRERSQPAGREHLGILEKKKDHKKRALSYQKKQKTLLALKQKAQDKNPDEFYFNMINSKLSGGVHYKRAAAPKYTDEQRKLMSSQDLRYINYKRGVELNKIKTLRSNLHMVDQPCAERTHTFFVETTEEVESFELDKLPSAVHRAHVKESGTSYRSADPETVERFKMENARRYDELNKRMERERQLRIVSQKMERNKQLQDKTAKKRKVKKETVNSAAVYKWRSQRKK